MISKGLMALEKIDHTICLNEHNIKWDADKYDYCACIDIDEFVKCYDTIEKELKALEIIKKHCEFGKTIPLPNMKTYYDLLVNELTQEECDLLKEVLKDETSNND